MDQPEQLLTASDISEILQISVSYAYRLLKTGEIRAVKMGRSIRTRPSHLEDYITKSTSKSPSEVQSEVVLVSPKLTEAED